jgi:hypothetical protein
MAAKHAEKHQARKRTIDIASDESAITIEDQSKEELSRKSTIEAALQSASPINEDDAYSYDNTRRQQPIKFNFDSKDGEAKKGKNDKYEETGDFKL